ncbi:hypothetical protein LWI29_010827 [Acer saccharum]|uniref:Protein kinase domain-containing protein n=1 Tax=Acer saccharum TaxID=4024 RepID=A0AA39USW3_ACESA|nr:hypothetical protein LWI29_010827 [Acer saccharum]
MGGGDHASVPVAARVVARGRVYFRQVRIRSWRTSPPDCGSVHLHYTASQKRNICFTKLKITSFDPSSKSDLEAAGAYFGVPIFSYSELAEATNNFNHEKELGDGGLVQYTMSWSSPCVEFIPNGTIADHLHGDRANPCLLTWPIRMNIAIETASALAYLHASDIIHRDVKTNNILLDNNFCVKVADFGLSRLFPTDVTHVSTAPQGTPGYVDPEYHQCYH